MKFLILTFLLLFCQGVFCQTGNELHYNFRHITYSDGLAGNRVIRIGQDSKGWMWFATFNNIQRYDGKWFRSYRNDFLAGVPESVGFNGSLVAGKEIYVVWGSKNFRYNPMKGKFEVVIPSSLIPQNEQFLTITDHKGRDWHVGNTVAFPVNSNTLINDWDFFTSETGFFQSPNYWYDSATHRSWLVLGDNLFVYRKINNRDSIISENKFQAFPISLRKILETESIRSFLIDAEQNLWISSWMNALYQYNLRTKKVAWYTLKAIQQQQKGSLKTKGPLGISCMVMDTRGNVWMGTYGCGLLRYNKSSRQFDFVIKHESNQNILNYEIEITCIVQDREENIWIGTDAGVNIFNPYRDLLKTIAISNLGGTSPQQNEISGLYKTSKNKIVVGTWGGGTTFLDSNFKVQKNYEFDIMARNEVWSFIEDKDSILWAGCQYGYINRYRQDGSFMDFLRPPESGFSTIRAMTKDKQGNLYFGLHSGKVMKWEAVQKKFIGYALGLPVQLRMGPLLTMFIDNRENIWAGTQNGLYKLDPITMQYSDSFLTGKPAGYGRSVTSVRQFNDSMLILGYYFGGGSFFNLNTKKEVPWNVEPDFFQNPVYALVKDQHDNIWIMSGLNLYYFDSKDGPKSIRPVFDSRILSKTFNFIPFLKLPDQKWAVPTSSEIVIFDPEIADGIENSPLNARITGMSIFDSSVLIDSFLLLKLPVHLKHFENSITLEFTPMNFTSIPGVRTLFRLEGNDDNWREAGEKYFASYNNLAPGNYTFMVKSVNGIRESATSTLMISISEPFWQTIWFRSLVILAFAYLIYFLVVRRIKVIRREAELKHKISETEMAALRAQMNPHFIFNCISAIDNLIQSGEKSDATIYLTLFARLIRNVLESSKNNVIAFQKDLESLKLYLELEQFRCSNKFSYRIEVDQELLNSDFKIPPLVVQPFVENAIHHGLLNLEDKKGILDIAIRLQGEEICYCITDNGVGRERSRQLNLMNKPEHLSYGMSISTERLERFNDKKDNVTIIDLNEDGKPAGTRIELKIKTV